MTEIPKQLQNISYRFVLLGGWDKWKNAETKEIKNFKSEDYETIDQKVWKPLGKAPFETSWDKLQISFDNPKLISHKTNFGVIGGFGNLRIIDCDDKSIIPYFEKALGDTYSVQTGSGGRHFYVLSEYDINHVLVGDKGEVRAKNYQVVSAPCRHPNGNYYKVYNDSAIKTIPKEQLAEIIKPYLRSDNSEKTQIENSNTDTSNSGVEFGAVCKKIREGKKKEQIFQEMMVYAKWLNPHHPSYREHTYNNALKRIKDKPQTYDQRKYYKQYEELEEPTEEEVNNTDFGDIQTDAELMTYETKPQPFLINNIIPENEIGILTGKRGARKTFAAMHLALTLASGHKAFGVEDVIEKKKVLFISEEDNINAIATRIKILKTGMGIEKEPLDIKYISFSGLKLDRADKKFLKFKTILTEYKPSLVIIDALARCITFEIDKDNKAISSLFTEVIRPLQREIGCSWLFIHHVRKGLSGQYVDDYLDEVRGGTELVNYCRFVLMCQQPKNQTTDIQGQEKILFKVLKMSNAVKVEDKVVSFNPEGEGENKCLKVEYLGTAEEALNGGQQAATAIKKYLIDMNLTAEFKTSQIKEAAKEIGFGKSLISEGLKILVEQGFLIRPKPRGAYIIAQREFEVDGKKIKVEKIK